MARPKKEKPDPAYALLSKIASDADGEVLIAGMLGATAALGGITPPLTRMLQAINSKLDNKDFTNALVALTGPGLLYVSSKTLVDVIFGSKEKDQQISQEDKIKIYGVMASGAMEAMIMMQLVKNPDLVGKILQAGSTLGGAAIQAAGEAVPF